MKNKNGVHPKWKQLQEEQEAAARMMEHISTVVVPVRTADGLYTVGDETGLTHEQMLSRTAGKPSLTLDMNSIFLGGKGPAS